MNDYRYKLKNQLREAYGKVVYTYTSQLKQMNILKKREAYFKIAQIILSTISSGGIISTLFWDKWLIKLFSAFISACLLGINLYFKNFDLPDRIKQHQVASDNLWYIREDYLSLLTDFDDLNLDKIVLKRNELQDKTFDIYCNAPKTSVKSYKQAQKALKFDEEQFFSPQEIDNMLPEYLRTKK